jgi:5'(3')-deoxyribonucleotidase
MDRVVSWDVHKFVKPECGKKIYDYLHLPDLYDDVQPIEGALEGVRAIRALGHEVIFLTSCAWGMTDPKARWFIRHGFCEDSPVILPKDFFPTDNKLKFDADMLIDDRAETIRAWVEQKQKKALLFDYPHNRWLDDLVPSAFWARARRVTSWRYILRYVENWGAI